MDLRQPVFLTPTHIPLLFVLLPKGLEDRFPTRIQRGHHQRVTTVFPHHFTQRKQPRLELPPHLCVNDTQRIVERVHVRDEDVRRVFRKRFGEGFRLLRFGGRGGVRPRDRLGGERGEETSERARFVRR